MTGIIFLRFPGKQGQVHCHHGSQHTCNGKFFFCAFNPLPMSALLIHFAFAFAHLRLRGIHTLYPWKLCDKLYTPHLCNAPLPPILQIVCDFVFHTVRMKRVCPHLLLLSNIKTPLSLVKHARYNQQSPGNSLKVTI